MIELQHLTKRFGGVAALDDVSLTLSAGERLGLVGENGAGKSSLMNVLYGLYQPDAGEVRFDGQPTRLRTPADALERGVGMVHQHFTLVPTLSVVENVVLGHEPRRGPFLDLARARKEVEATCQRFGFALPLDTTVGELSVGSQQKVEIVKALHRGIRTLILDEPTAVLTPQEADELFAVTRALSAQGLAVVLITHKLAEVLAFATRVVVMRRGRKVAEVVPGEVDAGQLARLMVDAELPAPSERQRAQDGVVALSLTGLAAAPQVESVTLSVRAGEIVGLAGVDGNGQRELAEVLTGLRRASAGSFELFGEDARRLSPAALKARGVAHIAEDRLRRAVVPALSVEENAALGRHTHPPFARGALLDLAGRRAFTTNLLEAHDVRPRAPDLRAGSLSGGNQQKLVVGRELSFSPRVLIAVQPTRGLDFAAVAAVRARLLQARDAGCAVLLVSLDLDEVLELSDRVLAFHRGRVTGEFARGAFDARAIGRRMLGVLDA